MLTTYASASPVAQSAAAIASAFKIGTQRVIAKALEETLPEKKEVPASREHLTPRTGWSARRLQHRGSISYAAVLCIHAAVGARGDNGRVEVRVGPLRVAADGLAA